MVRRQAGGAGAEEDARRIVDHLAQIRFRFERVAQPGSGKAAHGPRRDVELIGRERSPGQLACRRRIAPDQCDASPQSLLGKLTRRAAVAPVVEDRNGLVERTGLDERDDEILVAFAAP